MKGLLLSELFFKNYGVSLLDRFALTETAAAGLVGEGSECFGFDDELSRDHDWGASFCLWLPEETFRRVGKDLQEAYDALPQSFQGVPVLKERGGPERRRGVFPIPAFYARFLRLSSPPKGWEEWRLLPETFLAVCTNGAVFHDRCGEFSRFREALLAFYPEDLRRKKISARCAQAAQSGQYNFPRSLKRGDRLGALHALVLFNEAVASLLFLLHRSYRPFYKWLYRSLKELSPSGAAVVAAMGDAQEAFPSPSSYEHVERIAGMVITLLKSEGLSEGEDGYLLSHAMKVQKTIDEPRLRSLPLLAE